MPRFFMEGRCGLLVLSRHRDEEIVIDTAAGKITVMVVDIRGDKVRLGISAPKSIPVHRREVQDLIDEERKRDGGEAA